MRILHRVGQAANKDQEYTSEKSHAGTAQVPHPRCLEFGAENASNTLHSPVYHKSVYERSGQSGRHLSPVSVA